jgi:putative hydrolase of the HAD superfamily
MTNIHHIFFDLDHTLWDFDRNAECCLRDIYSVNELQSRGVATVELFIETFTVHNRAMWKQLEAKEITHDYLRDERFNVVLKTLKVEPDVTLSNRLNDDFLESLTEQTHLIDGTIELLDYLAPKYELHILSNGFDVIQRKKMRLSGLEKYFKNVITYDTAQVRKPDRKIFEAAIDLAVTKAENSVMIGDTIEADVNGALNVGMHAIWYDPKAAEAPLSSFRHVQHLSALKDMF